MFTVITIQKNGNEYLKKKILFKWMRQFALGHFLLFCNIDIRYQYPTVCLIRTKNLSNISNSFLFIDGFHWSYPNANDSSGEIPL